MKALATTVSFDVNFDEYMECVKNEVRNIKEIGRIYKKGEYWIYMIIEDVVDICINRFIKLDICDFMKRFSKKRGYIMEMYDDCWSEEEYISRRKYVRLNRKSKRWNNRGMLIFDKFIDKKEWVDYVRERLDDIDIYEIGYIGYIGRENGIIVEEFVSELYVSVSLDSKIVVEEKIGRTAACVKRFDYVGRCMSVDGLSSIWFGYEKRCMIDFNR